MKTKQMVPVEIMVAKQDKTWTTITVKVEAGRGLEKRAIGRAQDVLAGDETVANLTVHHIGEPEDPAPEPPVDCADGAYVLKQDVTNPEPDRRSKDWAKQEKFAKGTRVAVANHPSGATLAKVGMNNPFGYGIERHNPAWNGLVAALEPVAMDLDSMLTYRACKFVNVDLKDAIRFLIREGRVTLGEIADALDTMEAEDVARCEEEEKAEKEKKAAALIEKIAAAQEVPQ